MNSTFSIKESFIYGWQTFKKYKYFIVPYIIILGIIQIIFSVINKEIPGFIGIFVYLAQLCILMFLNASLTKNMLSIYKGDTLTLKNNIWCATKKEAWRYFKQQLMSSLISFGIVFLFGVSFIPLVGGALIGGTSISVGLIVLSIVLGILFFLALVYIIIPLWLLPYIVMDKEWSITESIRYTYKITKNNKWKLTLYAILGVLLILLGVIALLIGLLVAIPVFLFASVHVYKKLDQESILDTPKTTNIPSAKDALLSETDSSDTSIELRPEELTSVKEE